MKIAIAQLVNVLFGIFIIGLLWYFLRTWAKSFKNIREVREMQDEILQSLGEIKEILKKP